MTRLPWHVDQWRIVWEAKQKNRLSHALLFVGGCELEKKHFSQCLATTLLCSHSTLQGVPCLTCHACHLTKAQSHPDLIWVEPEEAGQMIKIDQIRGLVANMHETSMQGGWKIVIINPAHAMNTQAANALLKTLEEPSSNTLLILISDQRLRLPATITSRCQRVVFQKPSREQAMAWLQWQRGPESDLLLNLADGFPMRARALQSDDAMNMRKELYEGLHALRMGKLDPLLFAVKCQAYDIIAVLVLLQSYLRDVLRYRLSHGAASVVNSDYQKAFADIVKGVSLENSIKYLDLVQKAYMRMLNKLNLNKQLLLEELWITWTRYVSC